MSSKKTTSTGTKAGTTGGNGLAAGKSTGSAVDIKDYLLDKSPGDYVYPANPYQVLLQTESDFIISRKKGRIERELVILISEGLFYFKEKDKIEEVTHERLKVFLRDLRGTCITLDQVLWLPKLCKDGISRLMGIITNPTFIDMARANVLTEDAGIYQDWRTKYWEKNSKLYANVHAALTSIGSHHYHTCMNLAFEVHSRFGNNEALYLVEALRKSKFEQFTCEADRYSYTDKLNGFLQLLDEPYNLDLRRLIDYTFIDSYTQGITKINVEFWQAYAKYLTMQIQVFGKIRDKYPRYLMTAHDTTALNIRLLESILSEDDFAKLSAEVRNLSYEDDVHSIVIPATAQQIAEDGIILNHCMGANAELIASGKLHILFLRNSNEKEAPLVTLQYSNDKITGAVGLYRRGLTADERKFLEDWGQANDVQIAV